MLAAVTLFASCSQEEIVSQTGNESLVSFSVITPELGSRVAGDGDAAEDLYYAVYDETEGEIVATLSKIDVDAKDQITAGTVKQISLALLNGHNYSLVFWAENPACPYAVDWDKKSINLEATTLNSNSETYDAFYAYVEPFTVTGPKQSTIELKRPFAQLNIGTTLTDLTGVKTYYGVEFDKSSIVVTTATAMDLTTGKVSEEEELTFAAAKFITSEKLKTDYEYLSMNYLLVSNEKNLVNVNFSITDGSESISKTFENIPVQRNYKTNIYGSLFTSVTEWEVEVKPEFNESEYNPAEQLAAAFEKGGEITLNTDVALTEALVLAEGKTATLNLNGHNIINNSTTGEYGVDEAIVVYGNLTIEGEGTVQSNSMAVWARGANGNAVINIKGGTFKGLNGELATSGRGVVYASSNNTINIYGGTFEALTADKTSFANKEPGVYAALNIKDNEGNINVMGGSFYKFNPAEPGTELPNWNAAHPTGFVAKGYTSVKVGDNYVVVEGTGVATAAELVTAITAGGTVILVDDIVFAEGLKLNANDAKINLNGHKINYTGADVLFRIEGGKNLTIDGTEDESAIVTNPTTLGTGGNGYVALVTEGSLTINGGSYDAQGTCTVAQVSKGKLIVNGGTFKVNMDKYTDANGEASYLLNCSDTPYKNGEAVIEVNGGSFYKFNPANNAAEGTGTTFLAPGHTSVKEGDWYVVK